MTVLRELNIVSIIVRMALSLVLGGILGLERGRKNRPAGLRTYMLVCLGSALVMMTNQYTFQYFGAGDLVRMGAQVISGIGFLGAGTIIMTSKNQVKGITTAAGLWTAACCGLAAGIGFYEGALLGGVSIFAVLYIMQRVDNRLHRHSRNTEVYLECDNKRTFGSVLEYARDHGLELHDVQLQKNKLAKDALLSVIFTAQSHDRRLHTEVIDILSNAPGVLYIEELQG